MTGEKLLNAEQVAVLLAVSKQRVYSLARQRLIPVVHLGRQVRFLSDGLEAFLNNGGATLADDGKPKRGRVQ